MTAHHPQIPLTADGRIDFGHLVVDGDDAPDVPLGMSEAELAEFIEAGRAAVAKAGRPSLTGAGGPSSPSVSFRVADRRPIEQFAEQAGMSVSELARTALDEYMNNHQQAS